MDLEHRSLDPTHICGHRSASPDHNQHRSLNPTHPHKCTALNPQCLLPQSASCRAGRECGLIVHGMRGFKGWVFGRFETRPLCKFNPSASDKWENGDWKEMKSRECGAVSLDTCGAITGCLTFLDTENHNWVIRPTAGLGFITADWVTKQAPN